MSLCCDAYFMSLCCDAASIEGVRNKFLKDEVIIIIDRTGEKVTCRDAYQYGVVLRGSKTYL